MEVISVNTGTPKQVKWRLRMVTTGIFKYPVAGAIKLGSADVEGDHVVDRKYHGGVDKACYLYAADAYPFWQEKYPDLDWDWGMFGENITIKGLDENKIFIGSTYMLGSALVEVSEPRQPCFKLGLRFGTQKVVKQFVKGGRSGVYLRVLEPGEVRVGDQMILQERFTDISIKDVFLLMYKNHENMELAKKAKALERLSHSAKRYL